MGNMAGPWSGPLSAHWMQDRLLILNSTLSKMRALGMTPVLPAFSGHIPCSLKRAIPSLKIKNTGAWEGFNATCFLDPTDGNFSRIGSNFLRKMIEIAGTDHVYSADQFNEMAPPSKDLTYLKLASQKVFDVMTSVDPDAQWVMQGALACDFDHVLL
jgi:alpha-N-acetylglucosaminidase